MTKARPMSVSVIYFCKMYKGAWVLNGPPGISLLGGGGVSLLGGGGVSLLGGGGVSLLAGGGGLIPGGRAVRQVGGQGEGWGGAGFRGRPKVGVSGGVG